MRTCSRSHVCARLSLVCWNCSLAQLDAVEAEEKRLKAKLEGCTEMITKMERRAEILAQRDEMLEQQKDPSRLLNKRDGGRLVRAS
jgi:hypothetical protein